MGILYFKPHVGPILPEPAGARLLGAIDRVCRAWPTDLTVTCTSDSHPPTDPHSLGRAFDIRSHDMSDDAKQAFVKAVLLDLHDGSGLDTPFELTIPDIWFAMATTKWFLQVEHHGEPEEHIHAQLRKGVVWPPVPVEGVPV